MVTKEEKAEVIENYGKTEEDTGSAEVQIALFTSRINDLTNHLKDQPQDHTSRRGLLKLVGKRRRLLNYLRDNDIEKYRELIDDLNIRK